MQESFIHYLWQYQYFDKTALLTTQGEPVQVLQVGYHNTDAGPDFSHARVIIGGIEWAGQVEIHYQASQWFDHHHDLDPSYDNVILHVVWVDDATVKRKDGTLIPTISLDGRVALSLISRYRRLTESSFSIPCSSSFSRIPEIIRYTTLDQVLVERLNQKSEMVLSMYSATRHDWEETTYRLLSRNFGFKVNEEPFTLLAQSVPYKILLKHLNSPVQVEAILFGQAGFLSLTKGDEYYRLLRREYLLLRQKYSLEPLHYSQWRFLRLRPANFPTVRIAQLAAMLLKHRNIFSRLLSARDIAVLRGIFFNDLTPYWVSHYHFRKKTASKISAIGKLSIDSIIVNSVVPLLAAYSSQSGNSLYMEHAINLLQQTPGENNSIIRRWKDLGWIAGTAFDSQAMIQLFNHHCTKRSCLSCSIGVQLVHPG